MTFQQWQAYTRLALSRYFEHRLEFVASLALMLLGLWLAFTPAPLSYSFLGTIAPLPLFGAAFFVVGFISRLAILYQKYTLRQAAMLAVFFVRLFLLGAVGYGTHWQSTTIPDHLTWCVMSFWAYLRLDREPSTKDAVP